MKVIKITIDNTVNNHLQVSYQLAETDEQQADIILSAKKDVDDWNKPGPGKMSYRSMYVEVTDIIDCTLEDLAGLPIMAVAGIFNSLNKQS